ncbi:MAG: SurA N-terminal domain-containing protein [Chthonomonas sp.]|nr:SurA N-terminal domain-containing protein [Chthonomonas sp.]
MKNLTIFAMAALASVLITGCNKPAESVAIVNGEAITMDDFVQHLKVKPEVLVVDNNGNVGGARVAETLAFQAMQDLINQRMILQLAKDMKVEPTAKDIENEVTFQKKRDSQYVTRLLDRGLSLQAIKASIKVDLARENLLTHSIKVTDQEVSDWIKNNPEAFVVPMTVDSLWIFVKDDRGRRDVDRALQAGGNFETVASRYSEAPQAKTNGGQFPQRVPELVPAKEIQDILKTVPAGKESAWVQLQDGWAKFFIQSRTPSSKKEVTDTDRVLIKRRMAAERGRIANDLEKRLRDKLQNAKITISMRELKKPWEAAVEALKNQTEDQNRVKSPTDESSPVNEKPGSEATGSTGGR